MFRNSCQGLDQSFYSCSMSDSDQFSIEMGGWGVRGLSEGGRKARSRGVWYVRAKTYCGYILIHLNISGTLGHAGTTFSSQFSSLARISKAGVSVLDRLLEFLLS